MKRKLSVVLASLAAEDREEVWLQAPRVIDIHLALLVLAPLA
jgi:hypothetical protein